MCEIFVSNIKFSGCPSACTVKSSFVKKYQKAEETGQMCPDAKEVLLGQPGAATKVRNIR